MVLKNGVICNYDKLNSGCCIEMYFLLGSKLINMIIMILILCLLNIILDILRWWNKVMIFVGKFIWFIYRKKRFLFWGLFGGMVEVGVWFLNFFCIF